MHHFAPRLRRSRWIAASGQPEHKHHARPATQHQRGLPDNTRRKANSRKYSTCRNFAHPSPNKPDMQHPRGGVQHLPARVPCSRSGKACNSIFIVTEPVRTFPFLKTRAIFCASGRECLSCPGLYSNACCGHRSAAIPIGVRALPRRHGRHRQPEAGRESFHFRLAAHSPRAGSASSRGPETGRTAG